MSTSAIKALVHAAQGGVAGAAQVHGKHPQQDQPGKIASAGFAQILGEQVAKSKPQAEPLAKATQRFLPLEVPTSMPHATPSPPATAPALAPNPRFGEYATLHLTQPAPRVSQAKSWQPTEAGPAHRAPALPDQEAVVPPSSRHGQEARTVVREAQPRSSATNLELSSPRLDKFSTAPQPSKDETAELPAVRIAPTVSKSEVRSKNPAKPTMAPKSESRSTMVARARIEPDDAQPVPVTVHTPVSTPKSPDLPLPNRTEARPSAAGTPAQPARPESAAHIPARPIEAPLPQPLPAPEVSPARHLISHAAPNGQDSARVAQVADGLTHAPSPSLMSAPTRDQSPAQPPAENRVPAKASEPVAPAPSKPSDRVAHVPPSPSLPAVLPVYAAKDVAVPTAAGKRMELPSQPGHTMHRPEFQPTANVSQRHTVEESIAATAPALVPPLTAKPSAQPPAPKASEHSKDAEHVVLAPQAQSLPRPIHTMAPPTTAPARRSSGPANLTPTTPPAPNQPAPNQPAPNQKESAPVQNPTDTGHPTVAEPVPAQAQKPQKRPAHTQAPAQVPSPSIPLPIPATIAQESLAPQVARNPELVSPPETARPIAAAPSSPRAVVARPASGRAEVVADAKPVASAADLPTPEATTTRVVTAGEHTPRAAAEKPAPSMPAAPVLAPAHAGTKGVVHAESLASKQRTQVEDEKEADETPTAPAEAPQANLRTSHAAPSAPLEVIASKPEVPPPAEHRASTAGPSQASSTQSTAGQPNSARENLHPTGPTSADSPAVFVPPTTLLSSTSEVGVREAPAPSPVAVETAGLVDRVVQDPGLSVNVMPHSAHLSITGDAGDLSLHVRVRDGSADVNVSGTMAPLFDSKAPEVRTVLASEGLQLGNFATDQHGGSQGHQGQPETATRTTEPHPLPPPRRTNTSTPEIQIAADRRIHVTA